jgi:hypothetical protein
MLEQRHSQKPRNIKSSRYELMSRRKIKNQK